MNLLKNECTFLKKKKHRILLDKLERTTKRKIIIMKKEKQIKVPMTWKVILMMCLFMMIIKIDSEQVTEILKYAIEILGRKLF